MYNIIRKYKRCFRYLSCRVQLQHWLYWFVFPSLQKIRKSECFKRYYLFCLFFPVWISYGILVFFLFLLVLSHQPQILPKVMISISINTNSSDWWIKYFKSCISISLWISPTLFGELEISLAIEHISWLSISGLFALSLESKVSNFSANASSAMLVSIDSESKKI